MNIGRADLRKALDDVLRTDSDFDTFCLDRVPDTAKLFTNGMDRLAKQNRLLERCDAEDLLQLLRQHHPTETARALARLQLAQSAVARPTPPAQPLLPPRRIRGEERLLTISVALSAEQELHVRYHVPGYEWLAEAPLVSLASIEAMAPKLLYQKQRGLAAIHRLLERGVEEDQEAFFTGAQVTGEQGIGRLLYQLLFPDALVERRVLAYLLDAEDPTLEQSPIRQPIRVRILTSDAKLIALPWRLVCWKGNLLADYGWTLEVTPELVGKHQVRLSLLSRILVIAPKPASLPSLGTDGHLEALRARIKATLPDQAEPEYFKTVHTAKELGDALQARFDVVYYFGHGSLEGGQVCLRLGDGKDPASLLTMADLGKRLMLADQPPDFLLINACLGGAGGGQSAGHLLSTRVPLVVCHLTPAYGNFAGPWAIRLLAGMLLDRDDPVMLLHRRDPTCAAQSLRDFQWAMPAIFSSTRSWEAPPLIGRRTPGNPLRLDRTIARAQVVDLVQVLIEGRKRRVEALVAYAADQSLIERFSWQATDYLLRRRVGAMYPINLRFPTDRQELGKSLSEDVLLQIGRPKETLGQALRRHAPKLRTAGKPVLWLNFGVCGDGEAQEKLTPAQLHEWLKWCSEVLAHEHNCGEELRIVAYLALRVEPSKQAFLHSKVEEEKVTFNSERLRIFLLPPLPKVEKGDLKDFLSDPDLSSCADNATTIKDATELIYLDTQGHYEPAVEHIRWAEQHGWQSLIDKLKAKHGVQGSAHAEESF